jgi:hypothetical protein
MSGRMKDVGTCHIGDGTNGSFCNPILMMGVGATVVNALSIISDVIDKGICFKSAAVGEVPLNDDSMVKSLLLKILLCSNGFHRGETQLMLNV